MSAYLCELCQKRLATLHVFAKQPGLSAMKEHHICSHCQQEHQLDLDRPIYEQLPGLSNNQAHERLRQRQELEAQLAEAVKIEAYEDAALIRDQLNALKTDSTAKE